MTMGKTIAETSVLAVFFVATRAFALTEGIWTYYVENDTAYVGTGSWSNPAIAKTTSGNIAVPATLGGYQVAGIGAGAFYGCTKLTSISLPETVTYIGTSAFQGCSALRSLKIPENVTYIGSDAFRYCYELTSIDIPYGVTNLSYGVFEGCTALSSITVPDSVTGIGSWAFENCSSLKSLTIPEGVSFADASSVFYGCSSLNRIVFLCPFPGSSTLRGLNGNVIRFSRKYGADWLDYVGVGNFYGFCDDMQVTAEVVSTAMRENNPTIMDIDYIVHSTNSEARVRVIGFVDGEVSLSNIVRAVTFVDGTESCLGDHVSANTTNRLSWHVSKDWDTDLAKVSFGVIAMDDSLLPLDLTTIPKTESHDALTYSWNRVDDADVMKALFWLVADNDDGLVIQDGVLKTSNGGTVLAQGTTLKNPEQALRYIYGKMGFDVLAGDDLSYVKTVSRLNLSPSGKIQYAVKKETHASSE